jgi:hypothetical protein
LGNSLGSIAGSQNRRNSSPMGVPGPTRHANSLSSLLNKAPPCSGNLNHFFSDQRFIVEAARVQPWSASEISQCVGMQVTGEARQVSGAYHRNSGLARRRRLRLTASEAKECCGSTAHTPCMRRDAQSRGSCSLVIIRTERWSYSPKSMVK